jgi:hypothetical protein
MATLDVEVSLFANASAEIFDERAGFFGQFCPL